MRITALEEYGLRCMILLAGLDKGVSLTIPEIGEREGLSLSYVGKLLAMLRKSDLIVAERGRKGGYALTRSARKINLKEILLALGKPVYGDHHCDRFHDDEENCIHFNDCKVKGVWKKLNSMSYDYFESITLAEMVTGKIKEASLETVGAD